MKKIATQPWSRRCKKAIALTAIGLLLGATLHAQSNVAKGGANLSTPRRLAAFVAYERCLHGNFAIEAATWLGNRSSAVSGFHTLDFTFAVSPRYYFLLTREKQCNGAFAGVTALVDNSQFKQSGFSHVWNSTRHVSLGLVIGLQLRLKGRFSFQAQGGAIRQLWGQSRDFDTDGTVVSSSPASTDYLLFGSFSLGFPF